MATSEINTVAKRRKLETQKEPHWEKVSKGRFIGFRKGTAGGSWIARSGRKREKVASDSIGYN